MEAKTAREKILQLPQLGRGEAMTYSDISHALGGNRKTARSAIVLMLQNGELVQHNVGKSTRYSFPGVAYTPSAVLRMPWLRPSGMRLAAEAAATLKE